MAAYTLFHNPMSRAAIAQWALHEVGADYTIEPVDWSDKPASLLQANALGKLPTLVHHHESDHIHVVTEAAAICHYLAEMHPDAGLLPEAHEKADYFRWLFFTSGPLEAAILDRAFGLEPTEKQKVTAGYGTYDMAVDVLDNWLQDHEFICGERFTMADVYVGSQIDFGTSFSTLPERSGFQSYLTRIREREAYKTVMAMNAKLIEQMQSEG